MAPSPSTTVMELKASPKPAWMDFNTTAGAMCAASPMAKAEISIARKACILITIIRNRRRATAPNASSIRFKVIILSGWSGLCK